MNIMEWQLPRGILGIMVGLRSVFEKAGRRDMMILRTYAKGIRDYSK